MIETKISSFVIHMTICLFRSSPDRLREAWARQASMVWKGPWLAKVPKAHIVPFGLLTPSVEDSRLVLYKTSRLPRVSVIFPGRITSTGVAADLVQVTFGPVQKVVAWLQRARGAMT